MYWNISDKERLIAAFCVAESDEDIAIFLADLFTAGEIDLCEKRLKAACLIKDGAPYSQIHSITGLSSNTIARISKQLRNKKGGFQRIMELLKQKGPAYFD
jgi:uncharacterized protein YerC